MRNKKYYKTTAVIALAAAMTLAGCGSNTQATESTVVTPTQVEETAAPTVEATTAEETSEVADETPEEEITEATEDTSAEEEEEFKNGWTKVVSTESYRNDFDAEDPENMSKSDWANGGFFDCYFTPDNIVMEDGCAVLSITEGEEASRTQYKKAAAGAEYTSTASYGYGRYTVRMKPQATKGVITSFFLYDNETADEIDIEFVGMKTGYEVEYNYYAEGAKGYSKRYTLGFDPTEDFHEYGFEWTADYIRWFVDGEVTYEVTPEVLPIPSHPCQIMMNLWNGLPATTWTPWGGKFDTACMPVYAYYDYIEYEPISE